MRLRAGVMRAREPEGWKGGQALDNGQLETEVYDARRTQSHGQCGGDEWGLKEVGQELCY